MIGQGHPESKENLKELRKSGAVLFFATDSNLLWAREGENWVNLGHVIPLDSPRWNQPIPKLPKTAGVRLMGVPE
jgi:hypothetical protein